MRKTSFYLLAQSIVFVFCVVLSFSSTIFCQSGIGTGIGRGSSTGNPAKPPVQGESYYFDAFGVSGVYVRDENNGYSGKAGGYFINQAKGVTYDIASESQASMVLSTSHYYVIRFRAPSNSFEVKVVRGVGNANPVRQVIFRGAILPQGTEVKLLLTPKGIGKLLYDGDGDGTFESEIVPSSPAAARRVRELTRKP